MTNTGMPGGSGGRSGPDRARRSQLMADAAGFPPATALPVARPRLHLALVPDLQEADAADFLPATALPEWMPCQVRAAALPVGEWWDAVFTSGPVGDRALAALGDRAGPVITDDWDGEAVYWWLVEPGSTKHWPELPGVLVLRAGSSLRVPPSHRIHGPGQFWHVHPRADHFTDPAALLDALRPPQEGAR